MDTTVVISFLSLPETFHAPYVGFAYPSALSSADTFKAPTLGNVFVPALASADTFVAPKFGEAVLIPVMILVDTLKAPYFGRAELVSCVLTHDVIPVPVLNGVPSNKKVKFPNTQGEHITLTFESNDDDSGLELYYLRHKMFKTIKLCSDQKHPNTQGSHIGIKLFNSAAEDFTLEYVSMEMRVVA